MRQNCIILTRIIESKHSTICIPYCIFCAVLWRLLCR